MYELYEILACDTRIFGPKFHTYIYTTSGGLVEKLFFLPNPTLTEFQVSLLNGVARIRATLMRFIIM